MSLRALRKKVHSERYGEVFTVALKNLEKAGELRMESGEFSRSYIIKVSPTVDGGVPAVPTKTGA